MNQEKPSQKEYDEVDLTDYIRVLIKRKRMILVVFLLVLALSGFLGYFAFHCTSKTRTVTTVLEIGVGNMSLEKEVGGTPIESPAQLKGKIESGVYGKGESEIKVNNPKGTNLVEIEITSLTPEKDKKLLDDINKEILTQHSNRINSQKNILAEEIKKLEKDINYLTAVGQQIAPLKLRLYDLQEKLDKFQPTKIIQKPTVSENPKKQSTIALHLIIGGVLGIFLGMFLAFGKEWWEKNKAKL